MVIRWHRCGSASLRVGIYSYTANAPVTLYAKWLTASLLIYEPFNQEAGILNGKAANPIGLTGNWTTTTGAAAVNVVNPTDLNPSALGSLATSGGQANLSSSSNTNGRVTINSNLANAGLLGDGATLWFSFIYQRTAGSGTNEHSGFAFGSSHVNGAFNGVVLAASGYAFGLYLRNNAVRVVKWTGTDPVTSASGVATPSVAYSTPTIFVGKIEWGANLEANDKITIYQANADLTLGAGTELSVAGFDQSNFNTISFTERGSTGIQTYDEFRFGATQADVLPAASSPTIASFSITGVPAQAPVDSTLTGITITAKDAANQTVTSFDGTVTFGGTAGATGTSAAFSEGVLTNVSLTVTEVGQSRTITVEGAGQTGSATLDVESLFQDWSASSGLTGNDAAMDADPDGDGLTNLQEFAFGTNPTGGRPGPVVIDLDGTIHAGIPALKTSTSPPPGAPPFEAVFTRRKERVLTGLTYAVEFSADLSVWTVSPATPSVIADGGDGQLEAVSVPFPVTVPAAVGDPRPPQFFRVGVSAN